MAQTTNQEKLKEQYGFLKRSIDGFLAGHSSEALRIATTLRVLVHETASSNPLLKQLDPNYRQLTIIDTRPPAPSKPGGIILSYIGVGVTMNIEKGAQPVTDLRNGSPRQQMVTLDEWWKQILLIFSDAGQRIEFSRKQLILTLANKEGGAHVDTDLPTAYEKFVTDSPLKFMVNGVLTDTVHLARFAAVQAAVQMNDCLERHYPEILT